MNVVSRDLPDGQEVDEDRVDVILWAVSQYLEDRARMCDMEKRYQDSPWYRKMADEVQR